MPTYVVVFMGSDLFGDMEIKDESEKLKASGVKIIFVGVGSEYNTTKATQVASSNLYYHTGKIVNLRKIVYLTRHEILRLLWQ